MPEHEHTPLMFPLAMVLCESADANQDTRKISLHGVFGAIMSPGVPIRMGFAVYACFAAVREKLRIKCQVVDGEDRMIAEAPEQSIEKPANPMLEAFVCVHFDTVEFTDFGHYFVRLVANGKPVMERRLSVISLQPADDNTPES